MSFIAQTLANQSYLYQKIDKALLLAMQGTIHRTTGKPYEPDYIATLVVDFAADLYDILVKAYPDFSINLKSVYCHQKPTVNIGLTKNPEIGDLLLVHIHRDRHGRKWLNSLLFQAKMSHFPAFTVGTAERHQLRLYMDWPSFTYVNSSPTLRGERRNPAPRTIHGGAQFLLIDDSPDAVSGKRNHFPLGCAVPHDEIYLDRDLAWELLDFLKFKSGRPIDDRTEITEDWSQIIWDLIDLSAAYSSKRVRSGRPSFSRLGFDSRVGRQEVSNLKFTESTGDQQNVLLEDDDIAAVSTIIIKTAEDNIG